MTNTGPQRVEGSIEVAVFERKNEAGVWGAREQHQTEFGDELPHFANIREGDMVEDGQGFPAVLIIAAAIFVLMILGAWAVWADPVGRTAATVLQAEGEGQ